MSNRPSRIVVPVYAQSYDGRYWGRYPLGNKPNSGADLAGAAQDVVGASGALGTGIRLGGAASDVAAAAGGLSTGIRLGAGASDVASATASMADPSTLPLVQAGDITYLGYFNLPRPAFGSNAGSFDSAEGGLAVSGNTLYAAGHVYNTSVGRVTIPAGFGGTATLISAPVTVPGSIVVGGENNQVTLGGLLIHNNRLIVQKKMAYDNPGVGPVMAAGNLSVGGFSSFSTMSGAPARQFLSGYMGPIPTEWQLPLGGAAFCGNALMSINSQCSNGPSFYVFNPDDVGVTSPIPTTQLMAFPFGSPPYFGGVNDPTTANNYISLADQFNAGCVFPNGTRSVLFFYRHGRGARTYKVDDGCAYSSTGEGAAPYWRQVAAIDANQLREVKNGTRLARNVTPYAVWQLPGGDGSSCGDCTNGGIAYDPTTRRIYMTLNYGDTPRVHVWQVAAL